MIALYRWLPVALLSALALAPAALRAEDWVEDPPGSNQWTNNAAGAPGKAFDNGARATNNGSVDAAGDGIGLADNGTAVNNGTIVTDGQGNGVSGGSGNVVYNYGLIDAGHWGIVLRGPGTIHNYGTIYAGGGMTRIDPPQLQLGQGPAGPAAAAPPTIAVALLNGGTLYNRGFIRDAVLTGGNASLFVNSGTVGAFLGGPGADTVVLETGTRVLNNLDAGDGLDELRLGGSGVLDFPAANFERLERFGNGLWDLRSDLAIGQQTRISGGVLAVNATLTSPLVIVGPGGTLGGTGRIVGDVTNNGTVAPGNSIGLLTINGNFTQTPNGNLNLEIAPGGSDRLLVTGVAQINGGRVRIIPVGGPLLGNETFRFLNAAGGVNGKFAVISAPPSAVLFFRVGQIGNNLVVNVSRAPYGTVAGTANELAVARMLDQRLPWAAGDLANVLTRLDFLPAGELRKAFDQIHPEPYDAYDEQAHAGARQYANGIGQRLAQRRAEDRADEGGEDGAGPEDPEGPPDNEAAPDTLDKGVFVRLFGILTERDSGDGRTGFDAGTGGSQFGYDARLGDSLLIGFAGEFSYAGVDWESGRGDGQVESFRGGPYLSYSAEGWFLDGAVAVGRHNYDTERRILIPGMNRTAESDHAGNEVTAYLATGGCLQPSGDWTIEPLVAVQTVYLDQEGFTESGADSLDLDVSGRQTNSLTSTFGLKVMRRVRLPLGWLEPECRARVTYEFGDDERDLTAHLADSPGSSFTVNAAGPDRTAYLGGLGLTLHLTRSSYAYLHYDAEFQSDGSEHKFNAGVNFRF